MQDFNLKAVQILNSSTYTELFHINAQISYKRSNPFWLLSSASNYVKLQLSQRTDRRLI